LLVAAGDAPALAAALRRLLQDQALALRLAQAAYAEAPRYSWDARALKLSELIRELT